MSLSQFFHILLARRWLGLGILLAIVGVTLIVSKLLPEQYTASTELLVDAKSKDPLTGQLLPSQIFPGYLATQLEILKSQNVSAKVVRELRLHENPSVQADFREDTDGRGDIVTWMADRIRGGLEVEFSRESSVIILTYSGADPRFAALLANAYAKAYVDTTLELKLSPARQTAEWFDTQIVKMRNDLDEAQRKLTAYQRENNIVESEERLDVETRRLSEISGQIVAAQSASFDASSRAREGTAMPEVTNTPVVQNLKIQIAQGEGRLAELGERLGVNHPDYQRVLAETASLRGKLNSELNSASRSVGATATAAKSRYSSLESAFTTQRDRVLSLKQQREQALLLSRDVENAQRIYDAALQRYGQSRMESQSTQTDIAVLNQATPPVLPSKPRVLLNLLIAVFVGTLLGAGSALAAELLDRRVRSKRDLVDLLGIEVLGDARSPVRGLRRLAWRPKRIALAKS